ncbi:MAG: type II toxin-antitoxin system PemK/MazF family toxin [Candidatus Binatia bacterium]
MRRGSVYWINLEPSFPPELGKVRPGILVSNTVQNERLDSVVVVPLSTRAPEIWPLRLRLEVRGLRESYAVVPGIRQVSKARLQELVAQAPGAALDRLGAALAAYLGG